MPRARQLADDELRILDLSLQEAQHALACEYGFGKWEDLLAAVEPPTFEDLVRLPDWARRLLVRHIDQRDMVGALIGAPRELTDLFLDPMSERVRGFILTEMDFAAALPALEVEAARERILAKLLYLREQGRLTWPPTNEPPVPEPEPRIFPHLDRLSAPLMDFTPDELIDLLADADENARREGILSLARHLKEDARTLLTEGLQLAVDGTEADLLQDLLETRAATILRGRTTRAHVAIEGWLSIHCGDNPVFVQQKMESLFVEAPEALPFPTNAPSTDEIVQRLRDTSPSCGTPSEMVPFYRDLATLRRQQGLQALQPLLDMIEDPVLVAGMRATVEEELEQEAVHNEMVEVAQRERLELHRRHLIVIEGVRSIQEGDNPKFLILRVGQEAEKGVAELAAAGLPRL